MKTIRRIEQLLGRMFDAVEHPALVLAFALSLWLVMFQLGIGVS